MSDQARVRQRAEIVTRTEAFVREELAGDSSGHDWWHVDRVRRLGLKLAREEGADEFVVELAALLHDVADYKLSGSVAAGPEAAARWLQREGVASDVIDQVVAIIAEMSFKGARVPDSAIGREGDCVRDADRLDAIGAIGIARAFAYGGHTGRPLHDPTVKPNLHGDSASYIAGDSTSINHFYEKLFLVEERMSTTSGQRIAAHRSQVMREFLSQFEAESRGEDGRVS